MKSRKKGRANGSKNEKEEGHSAIPYAGVIQIRFNGYLLRPYGHPCKKCYVRIYRKLENQSQGILTLFRSQKIIPAVSRLICQDELSIFFIKFGTSIMCLKNRHFLTPRELPLQRHQFIDASAHLDLTTMQELKYLAGYSEDLRHQVQGLISKNTLAKLLMKKYPSAHEIHTDRALYDYVMAIKNEYMQKSQPLSKVIFDPKIQMKNQALGLHKFVSRVQGKKLKAKNEICIASTFKKAPEPFLRMIVVHELAHLKEKDHNKAFFKLCTFMEPAYHQLEFDMRLYLTQLDLFGPLDRHSL